MRSKQFFVYIMSNDPKGATLYTGITGDLRHRVWQHKNRITPGFTGLIASMNPRWEDLARDWQNIYKPDSVTRKEIPRPAGENAGSSG